ncbi:MAG: serine/threonine protein kinase [Deltaproteobacteria bacterium]|nr:serine/threonine protein kinase [Deltaproteobacteria bacterium]
MKIDRYELEQQLTKNIETTAYRAFDPRLKREVLIKLFTAAENNNNNFQVEAKSLTTLNHPSIIKIYDFGISNDDVPYLVTEYIQGINLAQLLERNGLFPESVILAIGLEVSSALAHAHAHSIIHRSINPQNILLERGRLVITDFSTALCAANTDIISRSNDTKPKTNKISGFLSPEQLAKHKIDSRADIFSVGTLLYFLATNNLPYRISETINLFQQFINHKPEALRTLRPEFCRDLTSLIHRALEPKPENRPQKATLLKQALQRLLEYRKFTDAREILALYEKNPSLTQLHLSNHSRDDYEDEDDNLKPPKYGPLFLLIAIALLIVTALFFGYC